VLPFICEGKKLQRKAEYLYRVIKEKDGRWLVSAYLEQDTGVIGPQARFDDEYLPDWIRKDVALLSLTDRMGEVPTIGHRVGDAYWLVSEKSKRLLKRREVQTAQAVDVMSATFFGGIR
jgi:hypothetical protein